MKEHVRLRAPVLVVCVLALAVSGCGGGSGDAPSSNASASATTSTAASPSQSAPSESPSTSRDLTTAKGVAEALVEHVPQMKITAVYNERTDPNNLMGRPGGYSSKIMFSDSRVKKDDLVGLDKDALERGGSIEVYDDPQQAKTRSEYISTLEKNTPILGTEYHYLRDGILVRVTGNLTPTVARRYKAAFASTE